MASLVLVHEKTAEKFLLYPGDSADSGTKL